MYENWMPLYKSVKVFI